MVTVRMDTRGMKARIAKMMGNKAEAEAAAVRELAGEVVKGLGDYSPRDTNRYVRGWALAARDAGVGGIAVPAIQPSAVNERLIDRLDLQLAQWEARLVKAEAQHARLAKLHEDRYAAIGRTGKWERDMFAQVEAAAKRVVRTKALRDSAAEVLAALKADPTALVIWGRRTKNDLAKGQLATVRTRVYGGTGKVERIGGRTIITLHNLEPHASIVESNQRVFARALARAKGTGLRKMGRKYVETLKRKAG